MSTLSPNVQLLYDLVATESHSGHERAASDVFVRHARSRDLEAFRDEVDNAIAHRGSEQAPVHIVLLGHIDTVPGDIPVRIEDGVLHGRGSVDAKGPLAAMLCAAHAAEIPDTVRVSVIGAAGEESAESPGARHILHQFRPDACIIGEPSGWDGVTLGYKGRLLLNATARVDQHHSAGPDQSACDLVHNWWQSASAYVDSFNTSRERVFDRLQTTILHMHAHTDGLAQTATLSAGLRLPPHIDPHELESELTSLPAARALHFESRGHEWAHATDRNDPVVRALSGAIREAGARPRPKLKTGTADLNVVGPVWQCPIAAYGPGDSALDHTPGEHLHLDEYVRSIEVLRRAIESLACHLTLENRSEETVSA